MFTAEIDRQRIHGGNFLGNCRPALPLSKCHGMSKRAARQLHRWLPPFEAEQGLRGIWPLPDVNTHLAVVSIRLNKDPFETRLNVMDVVIVLQLQREEGRREQTRSIRKVRAQ